MLEVSKAISFSSGFFHAPRSLLTALTALLFALCSYADAQQPGKMFRIGRLVMVGTLLTSWTNSTFARYGVFAGSSHACRLPEANLSLRRQ